jgi:transcription elongation factor GreA
MSDKKVYLTKEGLEKLKAEIKHMESVERPHISQQIADARDKGDLSENAEYDAAKEAQGLLELKLSKKKTILGNARLVDESQVDTSRAYILSTVRVLNAKMGKQFSYRLVAENEADLALGKISVESPIGKGLLGREVGDIADIQVPNGVLQFEVLEITR